MCLGYSAETSRTLRGNLAPESEVLGPHNKWAGQAAFAKVTLVPTWRMHTAKGELELERHITGD